MAALVTLAAAKITLKIEDSDHDAEVQQKLDIASADVVAYLKSRADPAWDTTTTPVPIQGAILQWLAALWSNRGDTPMDPKLWEAVARRLSPYRDPAFA
mgnify:CR=1 FL=1